MKNKEVRKVKPNYDVDNKKERKTFKKCEYCNKEMKQEKSNTVCKRCTEIENDRN